MRYTVLHEAGLTELSNAVMHKLKQGWKCQGGIAGSYHSGFFQAMVLDE
jgi:hypothetical protein